VKQVSYSAREKCDFKKIVLDPSGVWLTVEVQVVNGFWPKTVVWE